MPTHADFAPFVADVIGRLGYWPYSDPEPVTGGTLNWNFGIETEGERLFVRRYRDDLPPTRIRAEHALLRWVSERGIPAPVPYKTETDETVLSIAGGNWSVFPWVEGEVRERGTLTAAQAGMLGVVHGATQAVLAEHPSSAGASMWLSWSKEESLALLAKVTDAARATSAEGWMLEALDLQVRLLESLDVLPPAAFQSLPRQLLHGDFHVAQVLWDGDDIVAVTDWEVSRGDPRVWELVRSLAFSRLLDSPLATDYLHGYRRFIQLSEEEARLGLRLWWQSRVVGLWAWQAYFLDGNQRAEQFLRATAAELQRLDKPGWREAIEERFVAAACG
ncbi:MAG: phosphotransferase [Dehalococcoidia bacterium]